MCRTPNQVSKPSSTVLSDTIVTLWTSELQPSTLGTLSRALRSSIKITSNIVFYALQWPHGLGYYSGNRQGQGSPIIFDGVLPLSTRISHDGPVLPCLQGYLTVAQSSPVYKDISRWPSPPLSTRISHGGPVLPCLKGYLPVAQSSPVYKDISRWPSPPLSTRISHVGPVLPCLKGYLTVAQSSPVYKDISRWPSPPLSTRISHGGPVLPCLQGYLTLTQSPLSIRISHGGPVPLVYKDISRVLPCLQGYLMVAQSPLSTRISHGSQVLPCPQEYLTMAQSPLSTRISHVGPVLPCLQGYLTLTQSPLSIRISHVDSVPLVYKDISRWPSPPCLQGYLTTSPVYKDISRWPSPPCLQGYLMMAQSPLSTRISHGSPVRNNLVPLCSGDILEQSYSGIEVDTLCSCHSAEIRDKLLNTALFWGNRYNACEYVTADKTRHLIRMNDLTPTCPLPDEELMSLRTLCKALSNAPHIDLILALTRSNLAQWRVQQDNNSYVRTTALRRFSRKKVLPTSTSSTPSGPLYARLSSPPPINRGRQDNKLGEERHIYCSGLSSQFPLSLVLSRSRKTFGKRNISGRHFQASCKQEDVDNTAEELCNITYDDMTGVIFHRG
uniref:Uncharacterized protein n=1 Tax=Timema monikensis TaxID=170555 RepID=A0A7R9DY91_9NEOP|nr:unnamed protein product [Timema monikensis]